MENGGHHCEVTNATARSDEFIQNYLNASTVWKRNAISTERNVTRLNEVCQSDTILVMSFA